MLLCVCLCVLCVCVCEREREETKAGGRKFALHGCAAAHCEAADECVSIDILFFGMLCTRGGGGGGGVIRGINMTLPPPPAPLKLNY